MGFTAKVVNIAQDPLRIGLLGAVCIDVLTQNLSYLVHEFKLWIWVELWFGFHVYGLKFWLEPIVSLATYHMLNPKKLGEIQGIIEEHKDEIIQEWQKHFGKR